MQPPRPSALTSTARVAALGLLAAATAGLGSTAACGGSTEVDFYTGAGGANAASSTANSSVVASTAAVGGAGGSGTVTSSTVATTSTGGAPPEPIDPWEGEMLENLQRGDFGVQPLGMNITMPMPDRMLGFTVMAEVSDKASIIGIYRVRPPVGGSVIFNFSMPQKDLQVFGDEGWVNGAVPQADSSDAWPVQEGNWTLVLGGDGSNDEADVRVYARRTSDGLFHGGVVDLNVFLPNGVSTGYMNGVLGAMFDDHYEPSFGLTVGTVAYYQLPAGYGFISDQDEYADMLRSTAGVGTAPAINLFVVNDFANAEFTGAIGVAGGIPGSPMEHGTSRSGVAYQPSGDADYDATVLAHEIGHLAGLFHTTEQAVDSTDSLSDTPECANSTITQNPNNCPDNSNLMFPIAYGGSVFTAAQAMVVQGSAIYRGALTSGGAPAEPLSLVAGGGAAPAAQPVAVSRRAAGLVRRPLRRRHVGSSEREAAEHLLEGHWCHRSSTFAWASKRFAGRADLLEAIARDPSAFDRARARALALLAASPARAAASAALADALLTAPDAERELKLEALDVLAKHDPARLVRRGAAWVDADPVVRSRFASLKRR